MPFDILPHPSDVGFRATGADFSETQSEAVAALASVITGGDSVSTEQERPVDAGGDVVALLDEVLYLLDAEMWLAAGARVDEHGRGVLLGAPFDPDAHPNGVHVKAITWHRLQVEPTAITVFVDL